MDDAQLLAQFNNLGLNAIQWQAVEDMYHATNFQELAMTEQTDIMRFTNIAGEDVDLPVSLISCKLWHTPNGDVNNENINAGRPTRSPYASRHVVIPVEDVFANENDFLIPINTTVRSPPMNPDAYAASVGGRTYVELLYVREADVDARNPQLRYRTTKIVENWRLKNNPFVRRDAEDVAAGRLRYRVNHNVWWIILTPYTVQVQDNAIWEEVQSDDITKLPRPVMNPSVLELVRELPAVFHG